MPAAGGGSTFGPSPGARHAGGTGPRQPPAGSGGRQPAGGARGHHRQPIGPRGRRVDPETDALETGRPRNYVPAPRRGETEGERVRRERHNRQALDAQAARNEARRRRAADTPPPVTPPPPPPGFTGGQRRGKPPVDYRQVRERILEALRRAAERADREHSRRFGRDRDDVPITSDRMTPAEQARFQAGWMRHLRQAIASAVGLMALLVADALHDSRSIYDPRDPDLNAAIRLVLDKIDEAADAGRISQRQRLQLRQEVFGRVERERRRRGRS